MYNVWIVDVQLKMKWTLDSTSNPYKCQRNRGRHFRLVFCIILVYKLGHRVQNCILYHNRIIMFIRGVINT